MLTRRLLRAARVPFRSALAQRKPPPCCIGWASPLQGPATNAAGCRLKTVAAEAEAEAAAPAPEGTSTLDGGIQVYESTVNMAPILYEAHTRCQLGASLGGLGFLAVLVAVSGSAPTPALAALASIAVTNTYVVLTVTKRWLQALAVRHVERITLAAPEAPSSPESTAAPVGGAEERLRAAEVLRVEVRTACLTRTVTLKDAVAPWEGSKFSGLVPESRVTFSDVCQGGHFFHIDEVPPALSDDPELLSALLRSPKVVTEEEIELRDSWPEGLRLQSLEGPAVQKLTEAEPRPAGAPTGPSALSSVIMPVPAKAAQRVGRWSMVGGSVIMLMGGLVCDKAYGRQWGGGSPVQPTAAPPKQ